MLLESPFSVHPHGIKVLNGPSEPVVSFSFDVTVPMAQLMRELSLVEANMAKISMPEVGLRKAHANESLLHAELPQPPQGPPPVRKGHSMPIMPASTPGSLSMGLSAPPGLDMVPINGIDFPSAPGLTPQSPQIGGAMAALNMALHNAVRASNVDEVRALLEQQADVNSVTAESCAPLHLAVEESGNVEMVHQLILAKAHVNAQSKRGKTPLHYAMQQLLTIPPLVPLMLIVSKADVRLPDARGTTTMDCAMLLAKQMQQPETRLTDVDRRCARQVLVEVTDHPTTAVHAMGADVVTCYFSDRSNERVIYLTETTVGIFDSRKQRVTYCTELQKVGAVGRAKKMSVNPEFGTVAICLEDMAQHSTSIIVWPSGKFQDEQPLVLTLEVRDCVEPHRYFLSLSRAHSQQVLHAGLPDGRIFCWRFNSTRSQISSEEQVPSNSTFLDVSSDGQWVVLATHDGRDEQVQVWNHENAVNGAKLVTSFYNAPMALTVTALPVSGGGCAVALVSRNVSSGAPLAPIEVFAVTTSGQMTLSYKLTASAPCQTLRFISDGHLLGVYNDGLIAVYDLPRRTVARRYCLPETRSVDMSPDCSLIASVLHTCVVIQTVY
eukprot:TRINITY_DN31388_c0_g1_i1.p1 TRINITY_DN31388_c0_g1~~TRINITY_DN31388_c0_g1_i1.p1  ORF type:complete len:607 (-),score=90.55 TRINITY_DN31388_c0_g1_i1:65-1885(-)